MSERTEKQDMEKLVAEPAFLRFLSRVIQISEIHSATTDGADGRYLVSEGRRDLGLNIIRDAARGMPADDSEAAFKLLLIQVLREEAQSTIQETPIARRRRYHDEDESDDVA